MTASDSFVINGLRLPSSLIDAIESGRWRSPSPAAFQAAFPSEQLERPTLFGMDAMRRENRLWLDDRMCSLFLANEAGDWRPDQGRAPKLLNIGVIGTDQPIALDYKVTDTNPRVVYLLGGGPPHWKQIADDLSGFMTLMGL